MPKPNLAKTSNNKILTAIKSHKLVVALIVLVLIFPINFAYNYYKDWDNAQMIKGLAKDFPALVAELESATGLDLEIKTDCSITQEKFSEGVKTCELVVSEIASQDIIEKSVELVLGNSSFESSEYNSVSKAHRVKYSGANSCTLSNSETLYFSCITAVREANIDLAREVFLNQ